MWRPRTYEAAAAAIGDISEGADLDFKEALVSNEELAKDVAAMTIHGGVILVGMHETGGLADRVTPVVLHGIPERIQQVIDSRVRPAPAIEIEALRQRPTDTDGFVVIEVLASRLAPHYANEKFPRRSGPVTAWMEEAEIEALYQQRQRLREAHEAEGPQATYVNPEGSQGSRQGGMGVLRLLVHPLGDVAVGGSPRLKGPLEKAVADAWAAVSRTLAHAPKSFEWLREWSPRSTIGWKAGQASDDYTEHERGNHVFVAATYSYTGQLSARVSMALDVGPARHEGRARQAFEQIWAAETCGLLTIAGHLYQDIPGVGLLRVDLFVEGLAGAAPSLPAHDGSAVAVTDDYYTESVITSPRELASDPVGVARRLLDRFFVSFIDHRIDVFSRITTSGS